MLTDIGEYIVGAHLKLIEKCDIVDYNVRPPGGGLEGLGELDVIGLNFETDTIFLCEVTTHLHGLRGKSIIERIGKKHERQIDFAKTHYDNFGTARYMYWSPIVRSGLVKELARFEDLELVINGDYKRKINALRALAKSSRHDTRNPFFRMLQIMEHLRD